MIRTTRPLVTATVLSLAALLPGMASAADAPPGAEACGGIELSSITECHFEFDGGCEAKCEPLRFVAACDGQCNASVDASCDSSCSAECNAACEVDPGAFDCQSSCYSDCTANIAVLCDPDDSECIQYCQADCSTSCETECSYVPPSASCEAECSACCGATCDVDANFECALDCSASLTGGCEVDCREPTGALFCDGQYIAVQDLPACVSYLAENFSINLEVEASASADASITGCSASPNGLGAGLGRTGPLGGVALVLGGLGLALWRRRRG